MKNRFEFIGGGLCIAILAAMSIQQSIHIIISKAQATEPKKNSAVKQCPIPAARKPDPCLQYHEKALKALNYAEKPKWSKAVSDGGIQYEWVSASIAAYSLLYQNCRDLERRNP